MSIPLAVSPSQLTPGLYLTVDLLAGAASPGTGTLRSVIIAPKSSDGDLTNDTEVRTGAGEASSKVAFGTGTLGHLCAENLYGRFNAGVVDFVSVVPGAGQATLDVTFSGSPSSNNAAAFDIMGVQFEVPWLAGESEETVKARAIAAVLQRTDSLYVTASSGGVGIMTLDAKQTGQEGHDVIVSVALTLPQSDSEAVTPTVSQNLSGASGDPDFTNALAAIAGEEYHFIIPCVGNTDNANWNLVVDHIASLNNGLAAKLQMHIIGHTGTSVASAVGLTVDGSSGANATYGQFVMCKNGRGLPAQIAGLEAGGRLAAESIDPAANRIGEQYPEFAGSADIIADKPTLSESETALGGGVSLVTYTANRTPVLSRPVTTHSQDDAGGPDRRLLDVQNVSATYIVARDIRSAIPAEFQGAKISRDTPPGEDPPPVGVIEERDIKGFVISRLRFWQRAGVITQASLDAAIADGSLIVQVNDSDETQVDIVLPFSIVQPLAKAGVVVQRRPN